MKQYKITKAQKRASFALDMLNRYKKRKIMKWKNEGALDYRMIGMSESQNADLKIYIAFGCGYINWNIFNLALDKIETKSNGTWMFDIEKLI